MMGAWKIRGIIRLDRSFLANRGCHAGVCRLRTVLRVSYGPLMANNSSVSRQLGFLSLVPTNGRSLACQQMKRIFDF